MEQVSKLIANLRGVYRACGPGPALAYAASIAGTLPAVARTRTLNDADRRMARRSWRFRTQGVDVVLDGRLWSGAREMYARGVYFPDPRFHLAPDTAVVDLGANSGLFTLLAGLRGCRVVAVEAQIGFVQEIEELVRRHGIAKRVALEHALVGAGAGVLSTPGALQNASHFRGQMPARLTMAELFARHGLEAVDFLKCDIEGSEFDLFTDTSGWLPRVRRIAMEVHCDYGSVDELSRLIVSNGFEVTLRDNLSRPVTSISESGGYLFAVR
jgi:FkbM family methyltransferase